LTRKLSVSLCVLVRQSDGISIDELGCSAIDMISILKNNVKKSRLSKLRLKENAYKLEKQNLISMWCFI
jgi:hypothetical protein